MIKKVIILIYIFIFLQAAFAQTTLEYYTWQATPESHKIVMVKRPDQTYADSMAEYISSLLTKPIFKQQLNRIDQSYPNTNSPEEAVKLIVELDPTVTNHIKSLYSKREKEAAAKIFPLTPLSELFSEGIFKKLDLTALEKTKKANMLFVAGEIGHLHPLHWRPLTMLSPFEPEDINPLMLAPVFDINLSSKLKSQAKNDIARYFDSLFLMGGDDINPVLYGQKLTSAKVVNPFQDKWELSLLKNFLKKGRGLVFGICRGMQLLAISQGGTLIQDLAKEGGVEMEHLDSWHRINTKSEQDSLLRAFVGNEDIINVYSYHHQAVLLPNQQKNLKITATPPRPDNYSIPESIQSRDGRGFAVQFHPELMGTPEGRKIMRGMARYANFYKSHKNQPTCRNLARDFVREQLPRP